MSDIEKDKSKPASSRRGFFYSVLGGAVAAVGGWLAGVLPRQDDVSQEMLETSDKISKLESKVAELTFRLSQLQRDSQGPKEIQATQEPLGQLEGGNNELVVFRRKELSVINPNGVLLNLVATNGPVGIRFYKDFGFGNEQVTNPWHMGYIEGNPGYQSLAILRDWRFTAALWDEDGKLILGRLDPHPPANALAKARFQVRGTVDEVQARLEAAGDQTADILQVVSADETPYLTITGAGELVVGSSEQPKPLILFDKVNQNAYALNIVSGTLVLERL